MITKVCSIGTALIVTGIALVVKNPLFFGICANKYQFSNYTGCIDESMRSVGSPLLFLALSVLLITIVVAFFPERILMSWLKFAAWAIPLLVIWISTQPVSPQQVLSTNRDDAARLSAIVFAVVSTVIIVWKYLALKKKPA